MLGTDVIKGGGGVRQLLDRQLLAVHIFLLLYVGRSERTRFGIYFLDKSERKFY